MARVMGVQVPQMIRVIVVRDVTYIGFGVVRTVPRPLRPTVLGK